MPYIEKEFNSLVDQLSDMTMAVATNENISSFDLRRILRFISKVIQVVEQAFQDVLSTLIEFKYVTKQDFQSGRLRQLSKELDLLQSRSRYRDAEEICSRLHNLGDFYRSEIQPLTVNLPNQTRWQEVFKLLDEYEGQIIGLVKNSIQKLSGLTSQSDDIDQINKVANENSQTIRESLSKLRSLNSQIIGLSGSIGLLELTEDQSSHNRSNTFINRGEIQMGSTFNVGRAGAVGPNAHASDMIEVQLGNNAHISGDFVVAKSLENSFNKINSSSLAQEIKELLQQLSIEVSKMIEHLPKDEARDVAEDLETLIDKTTCEKPKQKWWSVSIDGLTKAAENLGRVGAPVLEIVSKIVPLLVNISV